MINADASQVYVDLRVLTARPDETETARAPHRLFGHRDAAMACTAADWAEEAKHEIHSAHAAGKLPILVGGTGLYLRTLIYGIAPIPEIDPVVRAEVRAMEIGQAHIALTAEDPAMAHLRAQDGSRIARALEVMRSTGRSISEWQQQLAGGISEQVAIQAAILLPPREWLRARCDARFEAMLEGGAVEEVQALRARDLDPALPAMRAIGVREIGAWCDGLIDRAEMISQSQAATRQYAKRQYTWFRHQPPASWSRYVTQLDNENIDEIAIKLRDVALTE